MFNLPKTTVVDKIIPKVKFYEKTKANSQLKQLFIDDIEQIIWKNKLSKDTINLDEGKKVKEIEIFEITLKHKDLSKDILKTIDKFIPYQILYILRFEDKIKFTIAYKDSNKNNENIMVVDSYYESDWINENECNINLNLINSLDYVYNELIKSFIPREIPKNKIDIKYIVQNEKEIQILEKEIDKLEKTLRKEKQFNKKVEVKKILREKIKQLQNLNKI